MVQDVSGIFVALCNPFGRETVEVSVLFLADQEQIRKVEGVRLCLRIEAGPNWRVDVDLDSIDRYSSLVVSVNGFSHRKFCGELDGTVLSNTRAFENECR